MNLTENHIKWISHFTESQFDNIVYKYLEDVYKLNDFVNTDGTNDGCNDIRIFLNGEKLKVAFQVTIQENDIQKKLKQDLQKTKKNIENYGYQKSLFFFYSQPVSEDKVNEYELIADNDYGIRLYLVDAKRIAFAARKHPNLLKEINKQYGFESNEKTSFTEVDRMLYDFYSFGSSAAEIKGQIIKSFIVHKLYISDHLSFLDMVQVTKDHFKSTNEILYRRTIQQLLEEEKIVNIQGVLSLTENEKNRIDVLKELFIFQEYQFQEDLKKVLAKFNINEIHIESLIKHLKELFESSFNSDKLDVLDKIAEVDQDPISSALTDLFRFIKSISNENIARHLLRDLIEISQNNDIIQKLSAGKMFASFVDPETIRQYLNQTERLVFLDTPVILYSLCLYSNEISHVNYYYNSVKDLFNLRNENKNLRFLFHKNYLKEVSFHFKEALLITDFDNEDLISDLGGSNNVFYNFYLYQKDNGHLEDYVNSFADFLYESFEISNEDVNSRYFLEKVRSQITQCLESINVSTFENLVSRDTLKTCTETFEECLDEKEKNRGRETIQNDSYMLATLVKDELSINEPIFVTWDLVFLNARNKFHKKIPASRLWHWFTPDRLNNHLNLLNFNLNADTITRDILTVIDDKFNLYKKTQTLLDTVSRLINVKTATGRKYVNAIKDFKRDYIYDIHKQPQYEYKVVEEKKVYPIENFMFFLVKHYSQNNIDDFKAIFQSEHVLDDVLNYFKAELEFYMIHKKQSEAAILKMDQIIKKVKESV